MPVCSECPLAASLDCAERIVEENSRAMNYPDKALGGIALTRSCLVKVADRVKCPGRIAGYNEQVNCPLRDATHNARSLATGPWNSTSFAIDLTKSTQPEVEGNNNTGQYL